MTQTNGTLHGSHYKERPFKAQKMTKAVFSQCRVKKTRLRQGALSQTLQPEGKTVLVGSTSNASLSFHFLKKAVKITEFATPM